MNCPSGNADGQVAQVVLARALHHQLPARRLRPADRRRRDRPRGRTGRPRSTTPRSPAGPSTEPLCTMWPPCSPAPGPMSTIQSAVRMVSSSCSTTISVLPSLLQPDQRLDQPVVVPLVQADRRLVQHVEHADQAGADLGGQPDALRLAAGQGAGRPVQRQVVQADVDQEPQPGVDLLEHPLGDHLLPVGRARCAASSSAHSPTDRSQTSAMLFAGDGDREDLGLEPGAAAGRARHVAHVALVLVPGPVATRCRCAGARSTAPRPRSRCSRSARGRTCCGSGRAPGPRSRTGSSSAPAPAAPATGCRGRSPRASPSASSRRRKYSRVCPPDHGWIAPSRRRALRVGDDQLGVDLLLGAEAGALRAGAVGRVEGERPAARGPRSPAGGRWGRPGARRSGAPGAGSSSGRSTKSSSTMPPARPSAVSTESVSRCLALALTAEPVDHHLDGVLLLLLELRRLGQRVHHAVDPGPGVALGLQLGEEVDVLALAAADDRGEHLNRVPSSIASTRSTICCGVCLRDRARRRPGSAARRRGRRAGAGSRRPR